MTETDHSQLAKIARQYYQEDLSLQQIAKKLNISMPTVSRLLARARREGIIEITIHDPHPDFRDLEIQIESTFDLKECSVVPFHSNITATFLEITQAVGKLLGRILHDGNCLGVSWGETLRAIGNHLTVSRVKNIRVIPIVGAMGTIETGIYPNSIARSFAERMGGVSYLVNAPAILDSKKTRNSVSNGRNFSKVETIWKKIDVAILSVSGLESEASVSRFGIFSSDEIEYLRSLGVVCLTNFSMIDENGQPVANKLSERMINLDLRQLQGVNNVILVASGPKKVPAILAALRGRIPDILVTDQKTASLLIRYASRRRRSKARRKA